MVKICLLTAMSITIVFASACGSTSTPSAMSPVKPAAASGSTAGELATIGRPIYSSKCASCHGDEGQPGKRVALTGPNSTIARFGNAKQLFDYNSMKMPPAASGSLSPQEYLQVTSYMMVQSQLVDPGQTVTMDILEKIILTK